MTFPPEVNDLTTREAIGHFQVNIKNAIKHINHICCYCSRFVDPSKLKNIPDNNAVLIATFETYILYYYNLDVCGYCFRSFNFCHDCWTCVSGGRESKFGISNKMPQLCCQYYPIPLEDLTFAEEVVIARAHLIVIILKLRPNNSFNLGTYRGVCGHSVLLSQNLGPLLILLSSKTTFVDDVVRVVWADKTLPQPEQLSRFVNIWKHCVIGALQWLVANNLLYENI